MAGLCFRCGGKYLRYQCKRQILLLEGEEEEVQGETEEEDGEEDNGEISIHALKGVVNNKIIKVEGKVKDNSLLILIDSGSTHSFFDEGIAQRLKCPLTGT